MMPGGAAHRAARNDTSPAFAYVAAPTSDVGKMTGSGVATASIGVPPSSTSTAGVVTTPPPTPNIPDRTPAPNPTRIPRTNCQGLTRRGASRQPRDSAFEDVALAAVARALHGARDGEPTHVLHLLVVVRD